jgi:O-antigen/teichoic acid export membrane protein
MKNSMISGVSFALIGQAFYISTQLGVLSALAHFQGPRAVGEFGLAMAVATPIFMLSNMGLRTVQSVDVAQQYSFAEYAAVRLLTIVLAVAATVSLTYFVCSDHSTFLIGCILALTKAFESISDLSYGAFQQNERSDWVARSLILRGGITLAVFATLLWLGAGTAVAFTSQLIVWGLIGIFLDFPAASYLSSGSLVLPRFSRSRIRALLIKSGPVGGGAASMGLQTSIPRLVVERLLGLEALGIFTTIGYLQQAGTVAANSIGFAVMARFTRLRKDGQAEELTKLFLGLLLFLLCLSLSGLAVIYIYGSFILVALFGTAYRDQVELLMLVGVAVSVRALSTIPLSLVAADEKFVDLFWMQLGLTLLALLSSALLIHQYGLLGAGYVLVLIAFVRAGASVAIACRKRQGDVETRGAF